MPSKNKVTYGPDVKKRAKRLLEALLDYVNCELEDVNGISLSYRWQDDEATKQPKQVDKQPKFKLVIETKLRVLEHLTLKDRYDGKLTKPQIRQALNDHLRDFLHILEDTRAKTQGEEDWHFTLKLWSKDKEKNLEQFEIEWEDKRPEKSKQQEETLRKTVVETFPANSLPKDEGINWQEICRQNLAEQKKFTTKVFQRPGAELQRDEIYIHLAIVERKPPKLPSRNQQEEKEEEKLIPITEEQFEDVLRQGKSQISQGRKIAIIGEPGSGKTTRLQKIADWILEKDLGLPIWISLADLTQPTITQYIEEIWLKQTGKSLKIDELTQQKDRIWLLLDGLDEMTSRVETRHVSALLGGWVQAARVVVTCRVNVWEADKNAFSGFDVFRNLEYNPEQVTEYIRDWFAKIGDAATGESLEAELAQSENSRLKELIQNPLRLWMLCQIWQTGGGLPETQAGLYGQFVDWVYSWKADEEILDQREAIDTALARLALKAMEQKDDVSRLRLRESWVLKVLGSRPMFQAVMKLGWLNRVERLPEAICVFYHATFQEYFAALAVDDWDYFLPRNHVNFPVEEKEKEYRIFEPQWKQVILLWLGRDIADKDAFIRALVNFDDGCGEWGYPNEKFGSFDDGCGNWNYPKVDRGLYEYQAYFFAAAGIAEFNNCSLANDLVNKIIELNFAYLKCKAVKTLMIIIRNAQVALFETNQKVVVDRLTEHLVQGSFDRQYITEVLGKMSVGKQVINKLIELLDKSYDQNIGTSIFNILSKVAVGNQRVIDFLVKFIKSSQDELIREQAIAVLGKIGLHNQVAIDFLRDCINVTKDESTLVQVAESLGKIDPDDQTAINTIVGLIETTASESSREKAIISLGEIGVNNPAAINTLIELINTTQNEYLYRENGLNSANVPFFLRPAFTNGSTCRTAARILGEIGVGNQAAIDALVNLFKTTKDKDIRDQAACSLGKVAKGNPGAIKALNDYIKNGQDEDIRKQVGNILWTIEPTNPNAIIEESFLSLAQSVGLELKSLLAEAKLDQSSMSIKIDNLLNSIRTTKDPRQLKKDAESLQKILLILLISAKILDSEKKILHIDPKSRLHFLPRVISALKDCLSDHVYQHEFHRFDECYEILWNIAQNLPYPDFYHAWHHPPHDSPPRSHLEEI